MLQGVKYPPKVQLLAGHEFLKDKYQLAPEGARDKGAVVVRDKLVAAMAKQQVAKKKQFDEERFEKMLGQLDYKPLKTKEGKFVADPTDPVRTPDGKLHFVIKKGDILLKVSPPKGDFLLLQMRFQKGSWVVVAEYIN